MRNAGEWFTHEDEVELLSFNNDTHFQQQFRSLYTQVPGFDPPTAETARALDFSVDCYLYPNGGVNTTPVHLRFERKIPLGGCRLISQRGFTEKVRTAISAKHQTIDLSNYAIEHGWTCLVCKTIISLPFKLMIYACTPQCGGERCRMELKRESEVIAHRMATSMLNRGDEVGGELARGFANACTNPERTCESCGERGDGMKACSRCELTFYCNRSCQEDHWKRHKKVCKPATA